jgi:hypothetical protein
MADKPSPARTESHTPTSISPVIVMDKKTFSIGILSVTALILLLANMMPVPQARAADAVKERDFTLVTSSISQGGEALYIVDNRTSQIGVFSWDTTQRRVVARAKAPILDMFHE